MRKNKFLYYHQTYIQDKCGDYYQKFHGQGIGRYVYALISEGC